MQNGPTYPRTHSCGTQSDEGEFKSKPWRDKSQDSDRSGGRLDDPVEQEKVKRTLPLAQADSHSQPKGGENGQQTHPEKPGETKISSDQPTIMNPLKWANKPARM